MNAKLDLKSLSDDELLVRLSDVLKQSRCDESVLVAHIGEVDARRLFAGQGFPSMFRYCIDVLNLSEAEAYRRIGAARLSRKYPVILTMLEDGRIHLCGIGVLSKHLTDTNYEGVLATAAHKSKAELEELVAELAPKPDVPPTVRKRPQPKAKPNPPSSSSSSSKPRPHAGEQEAPAARVVVRPAKPEPSASVKPLAPARYQVTFTASAELRDKLPPSPFGLRRGFDEALAKSNRRLQALMPERDLACIIDVAVSAELERLEAKRFGKTNKPRKHVDDADTATRSAWNLGCGEAFRMGARWWTM